MHLPACLPRSIARHLVAGLMAGGMLGGIAAAQSVANDNPFQRREDGSVAAPVTGEPNLEALQFSGVSSISNARSFNFTDTRTRKSFWIPLHGTENGYTVESYDEGNEQVVVRYGGRTRPISLRKAVLVSAPNSPAPRPSGMTPAPTATAAAPTAGNGVDEIKNPKTPAEIKQAEYEARMLVSDLLDISMKAREEQRKLREAQQRGAAAPASR